MDDYRIILIPEEENEWRGSGVEVKVMKKVNTTTDPDLARYETCFEQFVTPFSILDNTTSEHELKLTEVIDPLKLNKVEYDISNNENIDQLLPSKIKSKTPVDTTVSRGFCLNIPQIGCILISHNADVILKIKDIDKNNPIPKSLYIETPGQVVLNPTNAQLLDLDIVSSATVISGDDKAILRSLTFRPIQYGNLTSGLFVDYKSLLSLTYLNLNKSLLMVLGELSINEDCKINGGYIFNMGKLNMQSDKNKIKNGCYFFNGVNGKFEAYKITIETSTFSNLGQMNISTATITTEKAFDNQGVINPTVEVNITGQSEVLNRGDITNTNGKLKVFNDVFLHQSGKIDLPEVNFFGKATRIQSTIKAKEVKFNTSTLLKHFNHEGPDVEITNVFINGIFVNEGIMIIGETLRTFGDHTEIHNNNLILVQHILNESTETALKGGEIKASKITVNKGRLQIESRFENLNSIEVDENAKLLVTKKTFTPNLKSIKSKGIIKIENDVSNLASIESEKTSHIQILSNIKLENIKSFNTMSGQTDFVNVRFNNVKVVDVPSDGKMNFFQGSKISGFETIIVRENASLNFEQFTIEMPEKMKIYNLGLLVFQTFIYNISSIYNGPKAELVLLEETNVEGRKLNSIEDSKFINISKYSSLIQDALKKANKPSQFDNSIGIFNEGRLLIKSNATEKEKETSLLGDIGSFFLCTPDDENDQETKNLKRKGLRIYSSYVSSKDAHLKLDNYAIISAKDFINYGTIYSPKKLRIDETTNITRIGTIGSENGIDFNIHQIPVCLNETFFPIVNGDIKYLNIISKDIIEIVDKINLDLHLNIEACKVFIRGNLTAQSLKVKTTEFHIDKNERYKYQIAMMENFEIYTNWFLNHSGILMTQNEAKKSKIICSELFQNTGAGEFSEDHKKIIYFTMNNKRSDIPHLDKAGLIAAGGILEIKAQTIDNCFGIINGISGLQIEAETLINNECGLIISTGKTNIKGSDIDNGRVQLDPIFNTCNIFRLKSGSIPNYFIIRNRNGYYENKTFSLVTEYQGNRKNGQGSPITIYPGYIFSKDDLIIDMKKPCYIGTLVSENDIYFKGEKVLVNSSNEMGTMIAKGKIKAEFKKAKLEQFNIQARNVALQTVEKLKLDGIIKSFTVNGNDVDIIDLVKFGKYLGYLSKQDTFRRQGDMRMSVGNYISTVYGPSKEISFSVIPTKNAGFIGRKVETKNFISTIQNSILNQLIRLTLTPFKGRDILLRIDLINELRETGSHLLDSATNSRSVILKNGDPALVFQQVRDQEVEMEIEDEKVKVPLCNPYLIMSSVTRMISTMKAEKRISLHSMDDIEVVSGRTSIESEDLDLKAEGQVVITSQYKYNGSRKVGVELTDMKVPNKLTISGDKGVITKGVNLTAKNISIKSEHGDIIDFDMPLDMVFNYDMPYHDWWTITGHKDTHSSVFQASEGIEMKAQNIKQTGTNIITGNKGVQIEADTYKYEPSYTQDYLYQQRHRTTTKVETTTPKQGGIISAGNVIFKTKNATLIGATIIAPKISNPKDGNFRLLPAYIDQHLWSRETKRNFWGSSSVEIDQYRHIPVGCQILTQHFEMLGSGTLEMEGVTAKIVNATILKNIEERAAYETSHTVITQSSSGFCPPKINGDCFINSLSNVANSFTCFEDAAASAFTLVSGLCQAMDNIKILTNLSAINNPMLSVAQIFLSRFVSSFTFCNVKTTTTIDAKIPYQSKFDIDVLRVNNDRTHLEGNWCIKEKGEINTKKFETKAPEHTIRQHTETSGYCISLSPAAIFGACLCPNPLSLGACLPNVSVFTSSQDINSKEYEAQVLTADDLFIRCDDAIFSGSTIEGRLVECIVSGDLTIEDLTNEFIQESHSSNFSVNLGGIFALVQSMTASEQNLAQLREQAKQQAYKIGIAEEGILSDKTFLDPRWKAIPQIRIASEKTIKKSVQNLASFCGREKFVLKVAGLLHMKNALVGLTSPDGIVVNPENREEVIQAGRVLNEKIKETYEHKKSVFNPCVSEFVQMMASYQSMQQTFEDIEIAKYQKALKEGLCVRDAKKEALKRTKELITAIDKMDETALNALISLMKSYITEMRQTQESKKENEAEKLQKQEKMQKQESKPKSKPEKQTNKSDEKSESKQQPNKSESKQQPNKSDNVKQQKNESDNVKQQTNKSDIKQEEKTEKKKAAKFDKNNITDDEVKMINMLFEKNDIRKSVRNEGEDSKSNEEFLNEKIKECWIEDFDRRTDKTAKPEEKTADDYSGINKFIFYATKSIIDFKQFIDEHQTEIGYAQNTIKVIMVILQIINPEYGLICVVRDLGLSLLMKAADSIDFENLISSKKDENGSEKGNEKEGFASKLLREGKEVIDQINFALSEGFEIALNDFAESITVDDYLMNQFIKAVKCLPDIILTVKGFYDDCKAIKTNYSQIKKNNVTMKQAARRLVDPIKNANDSVNRFTDNMMNNDYYNNKKFMEQNLKPEDGHTYEMKNTPKPPPMTPPPPPPPKAASSSSATSSANTQGVNIQASFQRPIQPSQINVNFTDQMGNNYNIGSGSTTFNLQDNFTYWQNYLNNNKK